MVHLEFTLKRFPLTGALREQCGLPFSCIVQPFAKNDKLPLDHSDLLPLPAVGRCEECYSYINGYCTFEDSGWHCSLCGAQNRYTYHTEKRYKINAATRNALPELSAFAVEVLCTQPIRVIEGTDGAGKPVLTRASNAPVYVALVDVATEEEVLELVRGALLAALEALPPCALFGLITFSDKISLYDVKGRVPVVRHVPVFEGAPLLVPLVDAMPLEGLLAIVGEHKEAIAAALELLAPDESFLRSRDAASTMKQLRPEDEPAAAPGMPEDSRGKQPLNHVRILTFLAGPPDLGMGKLQLLQTIPPMAQPAPASPGAPAPPQGPPPGASTVSPANMSLMAADMGIAGAVELNMQMADPKNPAPEPISPRNTAGMPDVHPRASIFYEQAAVAAAALGVCMDVFALCPPWCQGVGLRTIEPVSNSTGGAIFLYTSMQECSLAQDVYRRLASPVASSCLLRLRTSPEFKAARCYGRLFADGQIDNLYHTVAVDPADTFALDFEFNSAEGFSAVDSGPPTLQVAFQYTALVPHRVQPGAEGADGPPKVRHTLQRRMRIMTLRLYTARTPTELYKFTNVDATMAVLMHKVLRAVKVRGVHDGRVLLRDWLVIFAAEYHINTQPNPFTATKSATGQTEFSVAPVDLSFPEQGALAALPRLVYAFLRSPLLAPSAQGHGDLISYLNHLWTCLPTHELHRAIYPCLSSYTDVQTLSVSQHSLSKAALAATDAPIFLLDAYILLLVLYTSRVPEGTPFPPPPQSLLRKTIAAIRSERRVAPQVRVVKEASGGDDVELFKQLLIDDPEGGEDGSGMPAMGLPQFLDHIRHEAQHHMLTEHKPKVQA